ncbi:MAG: hypothetical protein JNM94_18325 [Phycisphaerae bacterium]|nr:hypothetical protein [Phycisphaerae bacterium]
MRRRPISKHSVSPRSLATPHLLACATLVCAVASASFAQNALDSRPRTPGTTTPQRTDPNSQRINPGGPLNQGSRGTPTTGPRGRQPIKETKGRGQGNALDSNLQVGSGRINSAAFQTDFNARNLIVTNSVAGGRGFRGTVGYLAPTDFRGVTAGDSTQSFRANSAISSTAFIQAGGFQERFSLAQGFGVFEYRRDATPAMRNPVAAAAEGRVRLDQAGSNLAFARQQDAGIEPVIFAQGMDSSRRSVEFAASGLLGLRSIRPDDAIDQSTLPLFERARVRREVNEGRLNEQLIIQPFNATLSRPSDARIDAQIDPPVLTPDGTPKPPAQNSAYDDIVRRIVERYGDRPDVRIDADPRAVERARADIRKVTRAFGTQRDDDDPIMRDPTALPDPSAPKPAPTDTDPNVTPPSTRPETPEEADARERERRTQEIREAAKVLNHGTTVRDLSPGDRARVDDLVRDAQRSLASGEFFKAERLFNQALLINPDNPLLIAGLANTQIGAGLYLSSALALRTLFADFPEMIDVRYDAKLMPSETRLRLAVDTLRARLDGKDGDSYGLMLAYIGHQLGDESIVAEGLAKMTGSIENDLMREFLSDVWLARSDAAPSAPPAEEKPADPPADAGAPAKPN